MDTSTCYLGLEIKNPIMVGSGPLTADAESVCRCEDAGAGAVVLKSLFEEQVRYDSQGMENALEAEESWHTEVFQYMEADLGMRYGPREYLDVIRRSKERVDIPVIASINCVSAESWLQFAQDVEAAGADAIELNIAVIARDIFTESAAVEAQYEQIVRSVNATVSIPVAVKLVPYFSAVPQMLYRLCAQGAKGFVLFNRLYRPRVDIEDIRVKTDTEDRYSSRKELSPSLRTIAGVAGRLDADFAAATGIHEVEDVVASLLVGANVVQVVSAPCVHGLEILKTYTDGLCAWMERHRFDNLQSVRGALSEVNSPAGELFGRVQYIKGIVGVG